MQGSPRTSTSQDWDPVPQVWWHCLCHLYVTHHGGMGAAGPVTSPEGGSWDPTGVSVDTPPVRTESHGNAQLQGQEAWPLQWSVRGHGLQTTESRCPMSQACPVHTWVHGAGASCLLGGACGHGYIQTSSLPDTMNGAWMVCEWGPRSSLSPCPRDSVPVSCSCSCGKAHWKWPSCSGSEQLLPVTRPDGQTAPLPGSEPRVLGWRCVQLQGGGESRLVITPW